MDEAAALRAELESTKGLARTHIARFKTAFEDASKACTQQASAISALRAAVSTSLAELDHLSRLVLVPPTPALVASSIERLRATLSAVAPASNSAARCSACGHEPLPEGATFCPECGVSLIKAPPPSAVGATTAGAARAEALPASSTVPMGVPVQVALPTPAADAALAPVAVASSPSTAAAPGAASPEPVPQAAASSPGSSPPADAAKAPLVPAPADAAAPAPVAAAAAVTSPPLTELSVGELRRRLVAAGVQYDSRAVLEKADLAALLALAEGEAAAGVGGGGGGGCPVPAAVEARHPGKGSVSAAGAAASASGLPVRRESASEPERSPTPVSVGGGASPTAAAAAAPADDGWVEVPLQDGRVYYYHRITRSTRWVRPEPEVAARLQARVAADEEATARRQAERLAGLAAAEEAAEAARAETELVGHAAEADVAAWAAAKGWRGLKPMRKAVKAAAAAAQARGEAPEAVASAALAAPLGAVAALLSSLHALPGLGALVPRPLLPAAPPAPDAAALKRAFFGAMKALHPDKTVGAELRERLTAQAAFAAVSAAHACLTEVRERLAAQQQAAASGAAPGAEDDSAE